jgi:hypothetical protein
MQRTANEGGDNSPSSSNWVTGEIENEVGELGELGDCAADSKLGSTKCAVALPNNGYVI